MQLGAIVRRIGGAPRRQPLTSGIVATSQLRKPPVAKPNYQFEKRQRELAKKRKKEEKQQRKAGAPAGDSAPGSSPEESPPPKPESSEAV